MQNRPPGYYFQLTITQEKVKELLKHYHLADSRMNGRSTRSLKKSLGKNKR